MKREESLKKPADFKKVFKEGKRFLAPCFVLYMRKTAGAEIRLGVSISKSHFKLATRRNRLRRVAKEMFKKEVAPRLAGYDFVITSRAGCGKWVIGEAVKDLKRLIKSNLASPQEG